MKAQCIIGEMGFRSCLRFAGLLVVISLGVLLLYANVYHHRFLDWDDVSAYVDNPHLQAFSLDNVRWILQSPGDGIWKPLTYLSFLLEFVLIDKQNTGVHLMVNPVLHAINAVLLGWLVMRILLCSRPGVLFGPGAKTVLTAEQISWAGVLTTVLFAIHPVNVEAVAWLSGRKELLCALFYVLAVHAWLSTIEHGMAPRWLFITLVCQLLAFACKSMAISIPFVFLLLDHVVERTSLPNLALWKEKWPFLLLSALIIPVAVWGQESVGALVGAGHVSQGLQWIQMAHTYVFYLIAAVFPVHLQPYYPVVTATLSRAVFTSLALFVVLLGVFWWCWKTGRFGLVLVMGWYLVVLLPVSGIIQISDHGMADRYAYLPLMSLTGLFAVVMVLAEQRNRWIIASLLLLLGTAWSWRSYEQVRIWSSDITLWEYAIQADDHSPLPRHNLGVAYLKAGRENEALFYLQQAASLSAGNAGETYFLETWMMACAEAKLWVCALQAAQTGMDHFPEDNQFIIQAGFFHAFRNERQEALGCFVRVLQRDPRNITALWGAANMLVKMQHKDQAVSLLRQLLQIQPDHHAARELMETLVRP